MTKPGPGGLAARMADIQPFHVMDILSRARVLESQGRSIVHMEIGEPDFQTPQPIVDAAVAALHAGHTHYTPALGLPALRDAISGCYRDGYGVEIDPRRIVITPGSSGALLLALGVLLNPGEQVLMTDPGYPCNRHFVRFLEGEAVCVPVDGRSACQLTADLIQQHWQGNTRVVMLASPANPTGALISEEVLQEVISTVDALGGTLIMDEIYHDLVYGEKPRSALAFSEEVFVVNSFSKYFNMTGWRLGWLVVPRAYIPYVDRLAQNLFLAASTPAQYAALKAFDGETLDILERHRRELRQRRDYLLPALQDLGFGITAHPEGAFYIYADCSRFTQDSQAFCQSLLAQAGVAITPGCDFGRHLAETHVRFAYTTEMANLEEGVRRLQSYLD